jgi:hypothetical protein
MSDFRVALLNPDVVDSSIAKSRFFSYKNNDDKHF